MLCIHILLMLWCTPRSSSLGLRHSFPNLLECCLWMSQSWASLINYFAQRERLLPSLNSISGGSLFSGPISGLCEGTLPAAHLPPLSTLMGFQSSPPWDWQLHWSQLFSLPNSPPFTCPGVVLRAGKAMQAKLSICFLGNKHDIMLFRVKLQIIVALNLE